MDDVESYQELYKSLTIGDYYAVKGKETLTDEDIFNRSWRITDGAK